VGVVTASLTVVVPVIPGPGGAAADALRVIAGRPLLDWGVEASLRAASVAWVVVSTTDPAVSAHLAGRPAWRDRVFLHQPSTTGAAASTDRAVLDFLGSPLGRVATDVAVVGPANPFLRSADVDGAYQLYRRGYDSVLSVVRQRRFVWADGPVGAVCTDYDPAQRPHWSEFPGHLVENGALYITAREFLLAARARVSGRTGLYEMPADSYTEIFGPDDVAVAETLLRRRFIAGTEHDQLPLHGIRMVLAGVDGVLTDNGIMCGADGGESKTYNARDSKGFELLRRAGILTGLVTAERGPQISARAAKMKADILVMGSVNKLAEVRRICRERALSLAEVAYIGDDVQDGELLAHVGFAAAPADAMTAVIDLVHHRTQAAGGRGAFREVADLILAAHAAEPSVADQAGGYAVLDGLV